MVNNFTSTFRFWRLILPEILFLNCYFLQVLLCAKGKDVWTFKSVLNYVLELAKYDLNYDVRDRAYILKELISCYLSQDLEEETTCSPQKDISQILAECIFRAQRKSMSPEPINFRFYLPGSLSQIVLHAAPGYEPLPKPCSLLCKDHQQLNVVQGLEGSGEGTSDSDSYGTDDPDMLGQSTYEESTGYSSQNSITRSSGSDEPASESEEGDNADLLIQLSDVGISDKEKNGISQSGCDSIEELLRSKRTLESWLDEQPGLSDPNLSKQIQVQRSSARISIGSIGGRVKPKIYTLLDPTNGNGLRVNYSFSSEISSMSPQLVCVELSFENCSDDSMSKVLLVDEESNRALDSADESLVMTER